MIMANLSCKEIRRRIFHALINLLVSLHHLVGQLVVQESIFSITLVLFCIIFSIFLNDVASVPSL